MEQHQQQQQQRQKREEEEEQQDQDQHQQTRKKKRRPLVVASSSSSPPHLSPDHHHHHHQHHLHFQDGSSSSSNKSNNNKNNNKKKRMAEDSKSESESGSPADDAVVEPSAVAVAVAVAVASTNTNTANTAAEEDPPPAQAAAAAAAPPAAAAGGSSSAADAPLSPKDITGLRLEAIFYPKFDNEKIKTNGGSRENEKTTNIIIRSAILKRVRAGKGYIEVSIKHSGSLVLWSGSSRYYSKNASKNQFTYVASILLQQWLARAWWYNTEGGEGDDANNDDPYTRLSKYVERNRLTIAMEVCTSRMLGDHGQIPQRDYVVVTAVACRQSGKFMTTPQLLKLCQQFNLPHNDVWCIFGGGKDGSESDGESGNDTSLSAAQRLFDDVYYGSGIRETGTTTSTQKALTDSCHVYIPSLIPHQEFQGEILEGFIIRYVKYDDNDDGHGHGHGHDHDGSSAASTTTRSTLEQLACTAQALLNQQVPPSRPPSYELYTTSTSASASPPPSFSSSEKEGDINNSIIYPVAWTTDLRKVYQKVVEGVDMMEESSAGMEKFPGRSAMSTTTRRQQMIVERFTTKLQQLLEESSSTHQNESMAGAVGKKKEEGDATTRGASVVDSSTVAAAPFKVSTKKIHLPSLTEHLLQNSSALSSPTPPSSLSSSEESQKIARLLQRLDNVKGHVNYTLLEEEEMLDPQKSGGGQQRRKRLVCIVHVLHDQTFFKYQKALQQEEQDNGRMQGGEMPLYRGFCIELLTSSSLPTTVEENSTMTTDTATSHKFTSDNNDPMDVDVAEEAKTDALPDADDDGIDDRTLMLKMKLIPYMVRTFICRNHLKTIRNQGIEKFLETSNVLLKRWGVSEQCHAKWMPFFEGWAMYVQQYDATGGETKEQLDFGPLADSNYLEHLEYYTTLYDSGKITTSLTTSNSADASASSAVGGVNGICLVVVGQSLHEAKAIAERYAVDLVDRKASGESSPKPAPVLTLEQAARMGRSKSCIVYTAIEFEVSPQDDREDADTNDNGDGSNNNKKKKKKNKMKHNKGSSFKEIRQYMHEKVADHSIIVCYGSGKNDIESYASSVGLSKGNMKKLMSIWYPFTQGYLCVERILLDRSSVTWDSAAATPSEEGTGIESSPADTRSVVDVSPDFVESCAKIRSAQQQVIDNLRKQQADKADPTKKNILVFFPGIPGCGKSSLVEPSRGQSTLKTDSGSLSASSESEPNNECDRTVIVKEGDVIGKKYWDIVTGDLSPLSASSGKNRGSQSKKQKAEQNSSNNQTDQNSKRLPVTFIADKNVPPPSWPKIGQIVAESNTVPIAVLPDDSCFQTTTIQGSRNRDRSFNSETSHFYPFSLKFLAVCMLRVLNRPPNSHNGKLDSSTEEACMVVVQFFSFYRYLSSESFVPTMYRKMESETTGSEPIINISPIRVPVLKSELGDGSPMPSSGLPDDLELALKEALQLRHGYDAKRVKKRDPNDKQMPEMEARLRACLLKYKDMLESMTVPLEESQASFTSQLAQRVDSLKDMKLDNISGGDPMDIESDEIEFLRQIKLVSLDVDRSSIESMLNELYRTCDGTTQQLLSSFLRQTTLNGDSSKVSTDGDAAAEKSSFTFPKTLDKDKEFIANTHVTMGVAVGSSSTVDKDKDGDQPSSMLSKAKGLYDKFHDLQGRQVEIQVNGLLWNETNAALAVDVGKFTSTSTSNPTTPAPAAAAPAAAQGANTLPVPACENEFQHITIWCKVGSRSVLSNNLPQLVKDGKAVSVEFTTTGTGTTTAASTLMKLIGTISFWNHQNQVITFQTTQ